MELAEYYKIIKKNIWLIVITVVVFVAAAWIITQSGAAKYQADISLDVAGAPVQRQADVSYYEYDNYYAALAAAAVSDNAVGWLSSPAVVAEVFKNGGYDLPGGDLRSLGKTFTTKKKLANSAVLDIGYTSDSVDKSERLIRAAGNVLKDKIEATSQSGSAAKFIVSVSDPVVITEKKQIALNSLIAALVGLFISLGIVFTRHQLKK